MNPAEPLLGAALNEHLKESRFARGDKPTRDDTRLRISDVLKCERAIAFGVIGVPKDTVVPDSVLMAFKQGEDAHDHLQEVLVRKFDANIEVPASYKDFGLDLSGSADAVYGDNGDRTVVEIKTVKDYPFKKALTDGPKIDHVTQGGMYADSPQINAKRVHIVYQCKNDGRLAEWFIDRQDPVVNPETGEVLGTLNDVVTEEQRRLKRILDDVDAGFIPWRRIPGFGVVKDPPGQDAPRGAQPWQCVYCRWQPTCSRLPVSRVPISQLDRPHDIATNGSAPAEQWDDF